MAFVGRNKKTEGPKGPRKAPRPAWGPGVHVSMVTIGILSHTPLKDDPLAARHEPSALEGWTFEVLDRDLNRSNATVVSCEQRSGAPRS